MIITSAVTLAACGPGPRFERDAVEELEDLDIVRREDSGRDITAGPDALDGGGPIPDGGLVPVEVAAGGSVTCARSGVGAVRCWGQNGSGQLGDGTMRTPPRLAPGAPALIGNVAQVVAGDAFACARTNDGTVHCWGTNMFGELGNGAVGPRDTPTRVGGLGNVVQLAAGPYHVCARLNDESVRCWGANMYGQTGNGIGRMAEMSPVTVAGITNARDVAAGGLHTCAALADGSVKCWGSNSFGELGDGTLNVGLVPVTVMGLSNVATLALGLSYSCALQMDGVVRCWGLGNHGQLGNGSLMDSRIPVVVTGVQARAITAGESHACAVGTMNQIACWGTNGAGQIGDGSMALERETPVLLGLMGVAQVSAGSGYTCATLNSGTLSCWGRNASGQLGNGTMADSNVPVPVIW